MAYQRSERQLPPLRVASEYPAHVRIVARYFSVGSIQVAIQDARNTGRAIDLFDLNEALKLREGLKKPEGWNEI
jgi:hypothetical protein